MENKVNLKIIAAVIIVLKLSVLGFLIWSVLHSPDPSLKTFSLDRTFITFIVAGFVAQIIDGALGMAYGVSCSSLLLGFGLPPAVVSASVHTAEVFTTGVSGLSHIAMKNINKKLFVKLFFTGIIGSFLGAVILSNYVDGKVIKPYISAYLLILGIVLLVKSFRTIVPKENALKYAPVLGFFGSFLDAIGGGGWGPIVTSNLISKTDSPREIIGTVNTVEFFVTFISTGVFLFFVGIESWKPIFGLIIGGVVAAPIGAYIIKFFKPTTLLRMVGVLIIITSIYNIYKSFS